MKPVSLVVVLLAGVFCAQSASAITVELAKKCREEAVKSHPMTVAGQKKGTATAEREAYQACIAKGSKDQNDGTEKK
jgi:hypothetical protein